MNYEKLWKELLSFMKRTQICTPISRRLIFQKMQWMELIEQKRRKDETTNTLPEGTAKEPDEETYSPV